MYSDDGEPSKKTAFQLMGRVCLLILMMIAVAPAESTQRKFLRGPIKEYKHVGGRRSNNIEITTTSTVLLETTAPPSYTPSFLGNASYQDYLSAQRTVGNARAHLSNDL